MAESRTTYMDGSWGRVSEWLVVCHRYVHRLFAAANSEVQPAPLQRDIESYETLTRFLKFQHRKLCYINSIPWSLYQYHISWLTFHYKSAGFTVRNALGRDFLSSETQAIKLLRQQEGHSTPSLIPFPMQNWKGSLKMNTLSMRTSISMPICSV